MIEVEGGNIPFYLEDAAFEDDTKCKTEVEA